MDIDTDHNLETKAGIPPNAVATHSELTHGELMRAFEVYK